MSPYSYNYCDFQRFFYFEIKPEMRDDLVKMRECGKKAKLRDLPHDCGMVDTYDEIWLTDEPRQDRSHVDWETERGAKHQVGRERQK